MKKTIQFLVGLIAALLLFNTCRTKEIAQPQQLLPESAEALTIDSVTNHHEDATYHYEYRTGASGDYQYNYDVIATDSDRNKLEGNINVEGKYGSGKLTDLKGNEVNITTEWISNRKLVGIDEDGNKYELRVKK